MLQRKDRVVIWPSYLDATKSRSEGRIVSKKYSVTQPSLNEIENAARELGLNPVVEPKKAYPKRWWDVSGRVLVDKKTPKSRIIKEIGRIIRKNRG